MNPFLDYLRGVRSELTHVSWPSRGQAIAYTGLVIGLSLVVAFVLGAFDFLFTFGLEELLRVTN
jgi:preprotein translocase SecE subunit